MHKLKEHIESVECLQDKVLNCLKSLDLSCDHGKETFYYIADIAKDLAEVMESEAEAAYYKSIAEAMKKAEEEEEMLLKMGVSKEEIARMGYDNWRYSSGRYAPTGKGHYVGHHHSSRGYHPNGMPIIGEDVVSMIDDSPWLQAEFYDPNKMHEPISMGYNPAHTMHMPSMKGGEHGGHHYNNYLLSRRHYTETKDETERQHMHDSARRHLDDVEYTMKDIWKDADPALKQEMKTSMQSLLNEMKI